MLDVYYGGSAKDNLVKYRYTRNLMTPPFPSVDNFWGKV